MKKVLCLYISLIFILSGCSIFVNKPEQPQTTSQYATDVHGDFVPIHKDVEESTLDPKLFVKNEYGRMIYNDPAFSVVTGVDVSVFQGDIDWDAVKADGIDYAMLRIGFRGYGTKGIMEIDDKFYDNYRKAKLAGVDVGCYFYSQAVTADEAREEARFVLDALGELELDYPIAYDWEYVDYAEARTANMTSAQITQCAKAFCEEIKAAGREVIIYFNREIGYFEYDLTELNDIDFWLAEYYEYPTFIYRFTMWQYTDSGTVDGINANVDLNVYIVNNNVQQESSSTDTYDSTE